MRATLFCVVRIHRVRSSVTVCVRVQYPCEVGSGTWRLDDTHHVRLPCHLSHRSQTYLRPFHRTHHTSEVRKYRASYYIAGTETVIANETENAYATENGNASVNKSVRLPFLLYRHAHYGCEEEVNEIRAAGGSEGRRVQL